MKKRRNRNVKLVMNKRDKFLDIYLNLSGSNNEYLFTRPFTPELYRLDNTSIYDIKRFYENMITKNSKHISRYGNSTYIKRQRNRIQCSSNSVNFLTKAINEYIMYECNDNISLI